MSRTRVLRFVALTVSAMVALAVAHASAQEPPECLSFNPADWPSPARPYFMLVVDTSGSMTACTTPPSAYPTECNQSLPGYQLNSCGMIPNRINDAKCALRQTVLAFAGQVNFGLATYASYLTGCNNAACVSDCGVPNGGSCPSDYYTGNGCVFNVFPGVTSACGNVPACSGGPGPAPPNFAEGTWRNGANVVVPMLQDPFWLGPPPPNSNVNTLLEWFDGQCNNSRELFAAGQTPIAGSLRAATQYFRAGWTRWSQTNYCPPPTFTYPTFFDLLDRTCRDINVILVTDGDDTCGTPTCTTTACGQADAVAAASDLFNNGVTLGTKNWPVRTHVINFAGGTQANTDAIASAGGTGSSLLANNEVQLAQGLANIIASAIQPETCNNGDDNCNGCTDEGYKHYCNQAQTCCSWTTMAERDNCLTQYTNSVIILPPDGDLTLLPCTTPGQQQTPSQWLCYNPGDLCDEGDNNCQDGIDEGQLKCGTPPHCPLAETCNGQDDDCDLQVDEGVCLGCTPSPEVCDGCDNDCDGIADDGVFPVLPCGLPSPPNCIGTRTCQPPVNVPLGTCAMGGGYGPCSNNPQPEVCDGIDNDCDQQVDEGFVSSACVPSNHPPNLVYGSPSQCQLGQTQCSGGMVVCVGGVGPSTEVCDGVDNDCDGQVDENAFGTNQPCGINNPPCTPGLTACVNGALICQGGIQPQPEVCDSVDNDCDGNIDEAPLSDGPLTPGCWTLPGTCCQHPLLPAPPLLSWCPPPGGTCDGNGTLTAPCNKGTLACVGGAWVCNNAKLPSPEVCDGIDNNCNGTADDGPLPGINQACGLNVPPCVPGLTQCIMGVIDCVGDVGPTPETCNNIDDDCDTVVDDNIPAQGPCNVPYDMMLFPNSNPALLPCQPGQLECNGMGMFVCVGGKGPTAELCDGIDNDCDAGTDELGAAPDGINGSPNPFPPPSANIGDACGVAMGACMPGNYACLNGLFACLGGTGPTPEECDCLDNDCDGQTDELPGMNEPALCSPGKDCVQASDHCQCAAKCSTAEIKCPAGQKCELVTLSGGGTGLYCVTDFDALCGDCSTKTVQDANMVVQCAPKGTDPPGCLNTPVCVCRNEFGCNPPCFNVTCSQGNVCSNFGPKAGECVNDICYLTGCPGCNKVCHDDGNGPSCLDNPCLPGSCPGETCKCNWTTPPMPQCVPSCANVNCASGQKCKEGMCVPTCAPPCPDGQVCDDSTLTCVQNMCGPNSCPNGLYCDPVTGNCLEDPCTCVVCPDGQTCQDGDCFDEGGEGGGGGASASGAGGSMPSANAAGPSGAGGAHGVFGMPTGGGGCGCDLGKPREPRASWLALLGVALAFSRRRSSRKGRAA